MEIIKYLLFCSNSFIHVINSTLLCAALYRCYAMNKTIYSAIVYNKRPFKRRLLCKAEKSVIVNSEQLIMPYIVNTVEERVEMIRQSEQGMSFQAISDIFTGSYPNRPIPSKMTVCRIMKKFRNTGVVDPTAKKIVQPRKHIPENVKLDVCLAVEDDSRKSAARVGAELGISKKSVINILKTEKYKSLKY